MYKSASKRMSRMLRRSHKELEKMDWNQQLNLRKRVCSFEIGDLQLVPTTQRYVPRNWVGRYITVRDWALQWAPKSSHGKVIDIAPWSFVCYILLNWYLFLISIDPSKHQIRVVSFFLCFTDWQTRTQVICYWRVNNNQIVELRCWVAVWNWTVTWS